MEMTKHVITVILVLLALLYAVQCLTPLRLVNDSIVYLSIATSAVDGHGFLYHGAPERYPLGYPAAIFTLVKCGIGRAWAFVGLNCLCLGLGLWTGYKVLRRLFFDTNREPIVACILFLLSFVVIKHETQMLSDIPYFGLSTLSLWSLVWASESTDSIQRIYRFSLVTCLVACSICIRTIGIALVPGVVLAVMAESGSAANLLHRFREHRRAVTILLVFLGIALLGTISRSTYLRMALATYRDRGLLNSLMVLVHSRLCEWGEVAINIPSHMLPRFSAWLVPVIGLFSMGMVGGGLWLRRNRASVVDVYTICYLVIFSFTPWADSRYLLPLLLLAISYAVICLKSISRPPLARLVIGGYSALFCVLGLTALAYSTRLSLSGSKFPQVYGDGLLRATYRTAFNPREEFPRDQINEDALYLLQRYEPRAFWNRSTSEHDSENAGRDQKQFGNGKT